MKKHTLLVVGLAIIVGLIAFWFFGTNKAAAPAPAGTKNGNAKQAPAIKDSAPSASQPVKQITITYENGTFNPSSALLAAGGTITWINKDSQAIEIGTDPHPSHEGNRDISNGEFVLSVAGGTQATSALKTAGEYSYHNHLDPSAGGMITVQ